MSEIYFQYIGKIVNLKFHSSLATLANWSSLDSSSIALSLELELEQHFDKSIIYDVISFKKKFNNQNRHIIICLRVGLFFSLLSLFLSVEDLQGKDW